MGYRSDVTGMIKFKSHKDRELFMLTVQAREDSLHKMCFGNDDEDMNWDLDYKEEPIMTFEFTNVKWYNEFPEVKAHYALCEFAVETYEAQWLIVQIGEDGATEEEGEYEDLQDYIYVVQHIETHFGK